MWLRSASLQDLDMINAVIERAVMTWDLPARVKRLSLPTYLYDVADLAAMDIVVAGIDETIAGVAAWEAAATRENPPKQTFLLLHGIFVDPGRQGRGIGVGLLRGAERSAAEHGFDGVLVKAQRGAEGFFLAHGFERMPVGEHQRDYPYRLCKPVGR